METRDSVVVIVKRELEKVVGKMHGVAGMDEDARRVPLEFKRCCWLSV